VPRNSAFKTDFELLASLIERANNNHDGHLTIMKFTTNWRVGFFTPNDRGDIKCLAGVGQTFSEAANSALSAADDLEERRLKIALKNGSVGMKQNPFRKFTNRSGTARPEREEDDWQRRRGDQLRRRIERYGRSEAAQDRRQHVDDRQDGRTSV
jgi:hypothetical protein